MQCGSAIDSINHAVWKILANQKEKAPVTIKPMTGAFLLIEWPRL